MDTYDDMVQFYELEHEGYLQDLGLYQGFAQHCGGHLLELGCGTGRLVMPLARMGFDVTGVDRSGPMLARALQKVESLSAEEASRIALIQGDMRHVRFSEQFALIFIALNTFVHLLTRWDQQQTLSTVAHHLSPEGQLIIDLGNPVLLPVLEEPLTLQRRWEDGNNGETTVRSASTQFDFTSQLEEMVLMYDVVDAQGHLTHSVHPFTLRHIYRHEMELLFSQAGLRTDACYGSYELDLYDEQSERMIFVASHSYG